MDDTNGDSHLAGSDFDSLFTEGGPSAQRSTKHQAPYDLLLASQTSSDTTSQTGRTRVDGKEFFCQVSSVTLKSSDDKLFEVDTVVVLQSKIIKQIIEDDCAVGAIPLFNVDSVTLEKVIDYCKKHAEVTGSTDDDDLKAWDIDFVTVDKDRLLDLAKLFRIFVMQCFGIVGDTVTGFCHLPHAPLTEFALKRVDGDASNTDAVIMGWSFGLLLSLMILISIVITILLSPWLIQAADYLDIKSLLSLTCQVLADMIKSKTPKEIRKIFGHE
ncbi:hypothetical protein RIF29_35115 [Crotalaria pallida]|uniref:SKP1 component POZ domain-containing protein n=1 Tax=Crotalaria pallida TaxID=3830 RepID=A0AAN9EA18_CROPI